uniref:Galectin n=1 Tax=Pelusios castaneus TaxID=367368 RepID=A0A8C8SB58_9SAUR
MATFSCPTPSHILVPDHLIGLEEVSCTKFIYCVFRFHVDLMRDRAVAFHLNPRFPENTIVRNSRLQQSWGPEECCLPCGMPLFPGQSFTINILCKACCFAVAVNGQHQFEYKHRVPDLQQIDRLEVHGDVLLTGVRV